MSNILRTWFRVGRYRFVARCDIDVLRAGGPQSGFKCGWLSGPSSNAELDERERRHLERGMREFVAEAARLGKCKVRTQARVDTPDLIVFDAACGVLAKCDPDLAHGAH